MLCTQTWRSTRRKYLTGPTQRRRCPRWLQLFVWQGMYCNISVLLIFDLCSGHRIGDPWASTVQTDTEHSRRIWDYRCRRHFPKSLRNFNANPTRPQGFSHYCSRRVHSRPSRWLGSRTSTTRTSSHHPHCFWAAPKDCHDRKKLNNARSILSTQENWLRIRNSISFRTPKSALELSVTNCWNRWIKSSRGYIRPERTIRRRNFLRQG